MPSLISDIEAQVRLNPLLETTASFWTSAELTQIIIRGIKDLWRSIVDLKQEHFLTINSSDVYFPSSSFNLVGIPNDIHKVYLIEPRDLSINSPNAGMTFVPREYNSIEFQIARGQSPTTPSKTEFLYAIIGQGSPAGIPEIKIAPRTSSAVDLTLAYVPTLPPLLSSSMVPIPGEADNALVAWTGAFARAKERESRGPDPEWLSIYATEKQHILQSLGLRQYQEPQYVDRVFKEYWT